MRFHFKGIMKGNKHMNRFIKGLMACGLVFAMTTPVFAQDGSPLKGGAVDNDSILVNGQKVEGVTAELKTELSFEGTNTPAAVVEVLNSASISSNPTTQASVVNIVNTIAESTEVIGLSKEGGKTMVTTTDGKNKIDISAVKMLTGMQVLKVYDKDGNPVKGKVTVDIEVPGLTKSLGLPFVLHYSTGRNQLELITPQKVDYEAGYVTVVLEDLSIVAIVYVPEAQTSTAITKPAVDTEANAVVESLRNNTLFYFAGVAVVAAAAGAVVLKKRNQE